MSYKPKLKEEDKEEYLNDLYNIIKSQGQKLYVKVDLPDSLWFKERDWGESLSNKQHRTVEVNDGSSSIFVRIDIFIEYLNKHKDWYNKGYDKEDL